MRKRKAAPGIWELAWQWQALVFCGNKFTINNTRQGHSVTAIDQCKNITHIWTQAKVWTLSKRQKWPKLPLLFGLIWMTAASLPITALALLHSCHFTDKIYWYPILELPPFPDSLQSRAKPHFFEPLSKSSNTNQSYKFFLTPYRDVPSFPILCCYEW